MLITFDLDGVLMENPFSDGVFPEIKDILYNEYKNLINKGKSEEEIKTLIWQNILDEYKKYSSKNSYRAYDWDMIIRNVSNNLGLNIDINIIQLVQKYCLSPYIKRYKDGAELLEKLNKQNHKLKVITNGFYKYQYPVMKSLNLNNYFSEIMTCDKAKSIKPEQGIFLKTLKEHDKTNWIHIGDSILMDIYGANKLEGKTIFIDRNLPKNIESINLEERVESDIARNYIFKCAGKEKQLNNINFKEKKIYPDYIISTLEDSIKLL